MIRQNKQRKDFIVMKKSRKILAVLFALILVVSVFAGCGKKDSESSSGTSENADKTEEVTKENKSEEKTTEEFTESDAKEYNIAMLKGPTAIGFIKAWDDSDNGNTLNKYNVTAYGAADEITAGLIKGEIDIAAVPCNLASVLYNKTEGKIKVAAVNTLGVLYMISTSDDIKSVSDLKGKTIYSTGQGTTPEYTLNYILEQNGLKPGEDVTIEYKSEATEVAAAMSEAENAIAMLPQPYVTTVLSQNENMKIVLDMTEEWKKVSGDSSLVTGVVVIRNEVLEENEKAFKQFLKDYKESTEYVNGNVEDAAALVEKHDIFKAAVATKAIPYCNITFVEGEDMKTDITSYLEVLNTANPQSVGGKLPDDNFYYIQ